MKTKKTTKLFEKIVLKNMKLFEFNNTLKMYNNFNSFLVIDRSSHETIINKLFEQIFFINEIFKIFYSYQI